MSAVAGLVFEEAGHVYRYHDKVVPSVTQLLSPLHDWGMISVNTLERAREFGVHVHKAVHLYNRGTLDEDSLDPNLVPRLNAYKMFLAETGFKVTASECLVYNEVLGYAGTYDISANGRKSGSPFKR